MHTTRESKHCFPLARCRVHEDAHIPRQHFTAAYKKEICFHSSFLCLIYQGSTLPSVDSCLNLTGVNIPSYTNEDPVNRLSQLPVANCGVLLFPPLPPYLSDRRAVATHNLINSTFFFLFFIVVVVVVVVVEIAGRLPCLLIGTIEIWTDGQTCGNKYFRGVHSMHIRNRILDLVPPSLHLL
ncbi:hypothetical protein BC939DRAFT_446577 [Gamsiella multidivaricata]|uniref:uncharacterized protein n=1 Tax=Gamsiella multidivaricata TaxID=101098 RepID=UPI0022209919|nr:uncharacterized protein BC939DRAFT_446577 [Gamsiella multidivaricata]KAI7826507.1 hypothetical protein BC939DRAFT_446577 [Gamsiella multidivaricata]